MNENEQLMQRAAHEAQQIEKVIEQLSASLDSLTELKETIEEITQLKKGEEILLPVANGIFIKGKIEDSSKLYLNVGEGIVLDKNKEQALKLLEKQEAEILKSKKEAEEKLEQIMKMLLSKQKNV